MKPAISTSIRESVLFFQKTHINIECPSLLPWVVSLISKKRIFLYVDPFSFLEVLSFFDIYKKNFVALSKTNKTKTPLKILNFEDFIAALSQHRCALSFNKISLFIVNKNCSRLLIDVNSKPQRLIIKEDSAIEILLDFLNKHNYNKVSRVNSFGDYVVRGGLIDVYSYGDSLPCRVSFLEERVKFYIFDLFSGEVMGTKKTLIVCSSFKPQKTKSIKQLIKKNDLVVHYSQHQTTIINQEKNKEKTIKIKKVSLKEYNINKKNYLFSSKMFNVGLMAKNSKGVVPGWFKKQKEEKATPLSSNSFLNIGDYYVHDNFGVCKYVGVDNGVENNGPSVRLLFSDGKMRLSASRLDLLSFLDVSESKIKLDSLGSSGRWLNRKKNYTDKAEQYVVDLIQTHKARKDLRRPPCVVDEDLQKMFASTFEHKETKDQIATSYDIAKDLSSPFPMNRLLCGDVGFGKTEVALRAVFLALYNNKKVLVLAPTTILVKQLYDCFSKRLDFFGYSPSLVFGGQNKAADNFKGPLLIGTHALLYKKEALQDVGFLVVDEEHRFGIKDKEKVITTNPLCDVLFMSATPLPRTLQFALSKFKTISTINTPPLLKKPIITDVVFYSHASLLFPIKNELKRGGLVYVVENSVSNVKKTYRYLSGFFPPGTCQMLYSSLGKNKINSVMDDFRSSLFSVLVSTSIVESGLDIGKVNTIVVNNAHCFGLSQLYQLRGRVGRSGSQAFAFFVVPKKVVFTSAVVGRLETLKKHVVLGSGYAIALSDLKQRGPGFLFGYKQSGRVPVGFEFYSKLVASFLSSSGVCVSLPKVSFQNSFLPVYFFDTPNQCVSYYRRFAECVTLVDLLSLKSSLFSLFGALPPEVVGFIKAKKLSIKIKKSIILRVVCGPVFVSVFLGCSFRLFASMWQKKISLFFLSLGINYVVVKNKLGLKIQYEKTKKDDYILIQSLGKILYEK